MPLIPQNTNYRIGSTPAPGMMRPPQNPQMNGITATPGANLNQVQQNLSAPPNYTVPPNAMNNNPQSAPGLTNYTAPSNAASGNPQPAPQSNPQQQQNTQNMQQQGGQTFQQGSSIPSQNTTMTPGANLGQVQQNVANGAPSLEQQALNGGGASNKQQISNFLSALNQSGAGSNNGFQNATQPGQAPVQNLVDPNAAMQNNGSVAGIQNVANTASSISNSNGAAPIVTTGVGNPVTGSPIPIKQGQQFGGGSTSTPSPSTTPITTPAPVGNPVTGSPIPIVAGQYAGSTPAPTIPPVGNPITGSPIPIRQGQQFLGGNGQGQTATPPPVGNPDTGSPIPIRQGQQALVSDENLKTGIKDGSNQINSFLQAINAHSYEYKHPEQDGVGRFVSPMAQELEKTELGKQAVINTPRGKMVDYGRLSGVNLAASSVLHKEQQKLQAQITALAKRISVGKKK